MLMSDRIVDKLPHLLSTIHAMQSSRTFFADKLPWWRQAVIATAFANSMLSISAGVCKPRVSRGLTVHEVLHPRGVVRVAPSLM